MLAVALRVMETARFRSHDSLERARTRRMLPRGNDVSKPSAGLVMPRQGGGYP
jgi:hypothetical protein